MTESVPTCSESGIEVSAPKDAENRRVPLDTKVMYDDKGVEYEVSSFNCVFDGHGTEWNVACLTSDSGCIYTRPLDSMYLEKPDSLEQLAEDLNRMVDCKRGHGYSSRSCAYADNSESTCDGCKFKGSADSCSVAALKDIAARVNRLCGDSE